MKPFFSDLFYLYKLLSPSERSKLNLSASLLFATLFLLSATTIFFFTASDIENEEIIPISADGTKTGNPKDLSKDISVTKLLGIVPSGPVIQTVQASAPVDMTPVILNGYILNAVMDVGSERKVIVNTPDGGSLYLKLGSSVGTYKIVRIEKEGLSLVQESEYSAWVSKPDGQTIRLYRILTK